MPASPPRAETPAGISGEALEALTSAGGAPALPILLVDDRLENLRTLEAVLEPLGYPLEAATSGSEALRRLLERDYALILLDVRMPGIDGLETAQLIKGRARTRDIPIVFLTAARNELGDMIRGYGVGAVDYVLKPFDPELLRSKVAVFAELESNRRALKRSEAFLRGAFEAAPIGKTILDPKRRILRSNVAFARLLGRDPESLIGVAVPELLFDAEDREALDSLVHRADVPEPMAPPSEPAQVDLRLRTSYDEPVWVEAVISSIESGELGDPMLLVQWVDLTARRRVEQARADLFLEQAARQQAEAVAERLRTLQRLSDALDSLELGQLLAELATRLADLFPVELAEVEVLDELEPPRIVQAVRGAMRETDRRAEPPGGTEWHEEALSAARRRIGALRLALPAHRSLTAAELSLLHEVTERAALAIRRAQLHEQERRIADELQRGLLPKRLPEVEHVELAAHYQAAGRGAEAGGDWYDAFQLIDGRVGIVVGDVTGRGIKAASTMGHLRSVTRAFALGDDRTRPPGEVLTRLNRYQLALAEVEMFTVVYAIMDPIRHRLVWANAGHLPPLVRTRARETRFLDSGNGLMGIADVAYDTHECQLEGDDILVLYSDGLVERRGESIDAGLERLARAAAEGPDSPRALCRHLLARVLPEGRELHDDVTAMVVRMLPAND